MEVPQSLKIPLEYDDHAEASQPTDTGYLSQADYKDETLAPIF